ncbi:MAG: DUF1902 domain-containing protein [Xanthobacteraceae bacterium]
MIAERNDAAVRAKINESPRVDAATELSDLLLMIGEIIINARWDGEAGVWIATSADVPGLVVEADTWPAMIEEVRLVLPDLLELSDAQIGKLSLTFRAEEHLDLAGA